MNTTRPHPRMTAVIVVLALWLTGVAGARRGGLHAHRYTFSGKLTALDTYSLAVEGLDNGGIDRTIQFKRDESSRVSPNVHVDDTVVVNYDYTLEGNVYLAVEVNKLTSGAIAPHSTFPATDPLNK